MLTIKQNLDWLQSNVGFYLSHWGFKHDKTLKLTKGTKTIYTDDKYEVTLIVRGL